MDEKHKRIWRRKAIRLTLRGLSSKDIRKQIPRSRRWLCKWQARYQMWGWRGWQSESRQPHRCAHRYSNATCRRVVCIRHQLEHAKLDWLGAKLVFGKMNFGQHAELTRAAQIRKHFAAHTVPLINQAVAT